MIDRSAFELATDILETADRMDRGQGSDPRAPAIEDQMLQLLKVPVRSFSDVRALAWFAHNQMEVALCMPDPVLARDALLRARVAAGRVAKELGCEDWPPSMEITQ